jgi:hypothetical protein
MSGAIPTLPQYASMAWCSVKAQGQLYVSQLHNMQRHFVREVWGLNLDSETDFSWLSVVLPEKCCDITLKYAPPDSIHLLPSVLYVAVAFLVCPY